MVMKVQTFQRQNIIHDTKLGLADSGKDLEQSTGRAINEYQDVINNVLIENDKARTRSAFNDFREASRVEYNTLQTNKGSEAIGVNSVSKKYDEWYDKESSSIADSLDNVDQQKAFKILSGQRRDSDLDSLATYEASQHKVHQLGVHNGEIASAHADVMTYYADDSKMEGIELGVRSSFKDTFKGLNTKEAEDKEMAGIYALRIKMLSKRGMNDKARDELEKHKKILQGAYLELDKSLKITNLKEKSQEAADHIIATVTDEQAQLDYARDHYDGEMEEKILLDLRTRQGDIKRTSLNMKNQAREEQTNRAMDVFHGKGSKEDFLDIANSGSDIATINNLNILAERLYPSAKKQEKGYSRVEISTSSINESQSRSIIDQAIQEGKPLTDTEIQNNLLPHIIAENHDTILEYNRKAISANKKANVTAQKFRIEKLYGDGTFGKNKTKAARIKNDILGDMHQWIQDNPGKNPQIYVGEKLDLVGAEIMAEGLGTFIENFIPGPDINEIRKEIASGDIDMDLVKDIVRQRGFNPDLIPEDKLEKIMNTTEFIKYKTDLIEGKQQRSTNRQTEDGDVLHPIRPLGDAE